MCLASNTTCTTTSWVRWSNLDKAVDNTVAAVTVERHRRMFLALASAARGLAALVHHDNARPAGTNSQMTSVLVHSRPSVILEALLGRVSSVSEPIHSYIPTFARFIHAFVRPFVSALLDR